MQLVALKITCSTLKLVTTLFASLFRERFLNAQIFLGLTCHNVAEYLVKQAVNSKTVTKEQNCTYCKVANIDRIDMEYSYLKTKKNKNTGHSNAGIRA